MKPLMMIGALVTALGIIVLVVGNFMNFTSHEKYPRDGKTQVTTTSEKVISIPPVVGGLALVGGIALMVAAARK